MGFPSNSFPISQGKVNLGVGKVVNNEILCIEEGSITVEWDNGATDTIAVPLGISLNLKYAKKATIVSGMFLGA